jgi:hypothetical protein
MVFEQGGYRFEGRVYSSGGEWTVPEGCTVLGSPDNEPLWSTYIYLYGSGGPNVVHTDVSASCTIVPEKSNARIVRHTGLNETRIL